MKRERLTILDFIVNFIVDKRNLLIFFYILLIGFSFFSYQWVEVENDITYYLAEDTNTRQGIEIMNNEFITLGMADVMISNISFDRARTLADSIEKVPGVSTVMFENSRDHYKDSSALFIVQFEGEDEDEITLSAMGEIEKIVSPYDHSISTAIGEDMSKQLTQDMTIVGVLASIVIIIVLIFTSRSYGEIPVLLITFGVAAILNMGTNFIVGKISFISNSVGVVLQLALAIDYAIILCHRYSEERENLKPSDASKLALKKAISEISSSSLTTMAGLVALSFMKFGIGKDLAFVMIKAILLSMLTVFTLMPGLLVLFSKLIDKTQHRSFVKSISILGRFSIKTRYIMPPIFIIILVASFIFSSKCPFLFSMNEIRAHRHTKSQIAEDRIRENFGENNMLALVVPKGEYTAEKKLLSALSNYEEVGKVIGLSNTEAIGEYTLTDGLNPRQFSELVDLDLEVAQLLYSAYAIKDEDYSKIINGINQYGVALIDMYQFLYEEVVQGFISLDDEQMEELKSYYSQLTLARNQMEGENFSRMFLHIDLKEESNETFDFISTIFEEAGKYYERDSIYLIGASTNALDLSSTFDRDNLIIGVLSVLFVLLILTFTFRSVGLPFILISVIQASIWINFSLPYLKGQGIYFLGFLIVSSIQMGANIDYAIVITSRFLSLKEEMSTREAVIEALNQGFPTVITSGTILAVAGILIGFISTDGATSVLGSYLGQGTIISIILVLFVLPQLLYLGNTLVERTSFKMKTPFYINPEKKEVFVDGKLKGYVKGEIDALVQGKVIGEIRPISSDNRKTLNENNPGEGEDLGYEEN